MQVSLPVWQTDYMHDRRAHRHRCYCCRRIINAGELVLMFRSLGFKGTQTMHAECGDKPFSGVDSGLTYREAAVFAAIEYDVKGMSYTPRAVFDAARKNAVANTVDFSYQRLVAFSHNIEGWPAIAL